jgi:hypothetical protein
MKQHFNPEKMEPLEVIEFNGKNSTGYQYIVTDPNDPEQQE